MIKPLKSEKKIETIFEKGTHIKEGSVLIKFYDFDDGKVSFGVSVCLLYTSPSPRDRG